eukprot:SAG11_NODE_1582_length_4646_cov_3.855949_2_plen_154_part_00
MVRKVTMMHELKSSRGLTDDQRGVFLRLQQLKKNEQPRTQLKKQGKKGRGASKEDQVSGAAEPRPKKGGRGARKADGANKPGSSHVGAAQLYGGSARKTNGSDNRKKAAKPRHAQPLTPLHSTDELCVGLPPITEADLGNPLPGAIDRPSGGP